MLDIENNYSESARAKFERAFANFSNPPLPPVTIKACTCASGVCPSHVNPLPIIPTPPPLPPSSRSSKRSQSRPCSSALTRRIDQPKNRNIDLPKEDDVDSQKDQSVRGRTRRNDDEREGGGDGRRRSIGPKRDDIQLAFGTRRTQSVDRRELSVTTSEDSIAFEKWLSEKKANQRQLELERQILEKAIVHERMKKLEMERKNFDNWLIAKKLEERRRKEQQSRREKEQERLEKERERKRLNNELQYRLWCKRKEEQKLENELRKEVERIRIEEERRKKMERNATAYEIWLRSSKNKPRPIPLNRGLDSLRASVSVSYVNPTPWEPNVERELDIKPTSQ